MEPRLALHACFEDYDPFILGAGLVGGRAYYLTRTGLNDAVLPGTDDACCSDPYPAESPVFMVACWTCMSELATGRRVVAWGTEDAVPIFEARYLEDGIEPLTATIMAHETSDSLARWRERFASYLEVQQ